MVAEDEDEGELSEATTPFSPPADSRRGRPTPPPAADFQRGTHQQPGVALEMTRSPGPVRQSSPAEKVTEPPRTDPETTGTTEAPDPDAVVCSGRPFDSFMQGKNGSVFAFRGERGGAFSDVRWGPLTSLVFIFKGNIFLNWTTRQFFLVIQSS